MQLSDLANALQACGFLVDNLDSETDVFAYLPEDEELEPLISSLALLGHRFEESGVFWLLSFSGPSL